MAPGLTFSYQTFVSHSTRMEAETRDQVGDLEDWHLSLFIPSLGAESLLLVESIAFLPGACPHTLTSSSWRRTTLTWKRKKKRNPPQKKIPLAAAVMRTRKVGVATAAGRANERRRGGRKQRRLTFLTIFEVLTILSRLETTQECRERTFQEVNI